MSAEIALPLAKDGKLLRRFTEQILEPQLV